MRNSRLVIAMLLALGPSGAYAGEKVTLCHFPFGNPENLHTIAVGEPAVGAHLDHGDALGECAEPSSCGDDVVQGTEGCDGTDLGGRTCADLLGAGATGTPSCTELCALSTDTCQLCGNMMVEGTEECDDGNALAEDGCSSSCLVEFCGDGIVQRGLFEECDPPDTACDGDPPCCDAQCLFLGRQD